MGKVKFIDPVDYISGKICSHTRTIYCHRTDSDKSYTSRICKPRRLTTHPYSANEIAQQNAFRSAVAAVQATMADPDLRAAAMAAYRAHPGKYTSLRSYLMAQELS